MEHMSFDFDNITLIVVQRTKSPENELDNSNKSLEDTA